ncbi:ABC transporter substrate-binding protein [Leptothermofonsia sichuanensis E412]|uniref:bifunctional serine/threonine-protein kinase/ABC transporter substrate-binding protein n=1 Tax=Leptothermofonsia sichuanensis TaxID=2917832 RepID=UPI001CA6C11D|nr:bifunctional serine/threonine-protein kinase/ABC transporter substrate-binding protein [Leptothermofonsia sichuanensis]QZZ21872.1 ABC transporter substrate-binding protein [Leptothermofonsia sichuanensis E412]
MENRLFSVIEMLGELLGARYKVIEILGSGGFGHTYIAEDTQRPGNPRCVLKHLTFASPNTAILDQVRRLFRAEAETLEKLGKHDQIPQLLAYFEENREFYLVQEFIEGRSLSQEFADGIRFNESQVIALLEDVLAVLVFVHSQGVIHRDIKPENLIRRHQDGKLVLIDFGAVKTISNTVAEAIGETSLSVPIYTSGYGASEQCLGKPRFSSDLYSLGMVAIQALTGLRPSQIPQDFNTSEVIWRDQVEVSDALAAFLDRMVAYHFLHRYQTASEALQALRQIISGAPTVMTHLSTSTSRVGATVIPSPDTQPQPAGHRQGQHAGRRLSKAEKAIVIAGSAIAATAAIAFFSRNLSQSPLFPELPSIGESPLSILSPEEAALLTERASRGEKILNKWQTNLQKQEGTEQFAAGNYAAATAAFQASLKADPTDPETLIYLNNARIGANPSYEIAAVAIPLGDDALRSALEVLRGVAQAQDEVNRAGGINGVPLKVRLVDDGNQPETARQLAKALSGDPAILGVVGHTISDTTIAAAEIYQKQRLVMVAPISSAVQLSNLGNYVFRTIPSDQLTARALVNHLLNRLKQRKVVVFFNSASEYSTSLKNEFRNALFYSAGIEPMEEFDLARPDFDPAESVNRAIAAGAEAIMLASDHTRADRAIQVIWVNGKRLQLLAGESLFSQNMLRLAGKYATDMVIAVPADLTQPAFRQSFAALWGTTIPLSWRTALGYDATAVLIKALEKETTRAGIQRVISQADFTARGSTGTIRFLPTGDRKGGVELMTVAPVASQKSIRYDFKPLLSQGL